MSAITLARPLRRARCAVGRLSLTGQFMLASLAIFIAGLFGVGFWVADQIEQGVVHRTAATTALYMDSFVAPHLQTLATQPTLTADDTAALATLLRDTALGRQVAAFKVWDADGRVLYSSEPGAIGQTYPIDANLRRAWGGSVAADISQLDEEENVLERQRYSKLLEIYTPVRQRESDRIIAVAEMYQPTADLDREVAAAQRRSWLVVAAVMVGMYVLLAGFVRRASDTIEGQRAALGGQVTQLRQLLARNAELDRRVRRAAARTTALNERFLRRFSAELHDGPAQDLSLALLRLDHVLARDAGRDPDLTVVQGCLQRALDEVRATSSGLLLPQLSDLSLPDTLAHAVRDHERRSGTKVSTDIAELPEQAPLPVKIAAYRVTQEALTNAWRHAGGAEQRLRAASDGAELLLEISDAGPGPAGAPRSRNSGDERLGLLGMRERVESLGGHFGIDGAPGRGTRVSARLPLAARDEESEATRPDD